MKTRENKIKLLQGCAGMTLPEVNITLAVFAIVMMGFAGLYMFSVKMNYISMVKLGASDEARSLISRLSADLREAGDVKVGEGDATSFNEAPIGQQMRGGAIMIYPIKTNTNQWIRYYYEPDDLTIRRISSDVFEPRVIVEGITNQNIFTLETFNGQVLTNYNNKRVIGVTLQFCKLYFPSATIGPGSLFDFYQVRVRIARRTIE
ncbi:MAG: PulJ/GspJ family protein [Verrucomicrobiia bacterium]|jgi:prepilin-type N-terminal cleavage/methylation domain-containing protein